MSILKKLLNEKLKRNLRIEAKFISENPLFITVTDTVGNVDRHTDVSLWYLLQGNRHDLLNFDAEEFHQIRWFHPNEIPYKRTDPHMKRFVDKVMKKLKTLNKI